MYRLTFFCEEDLPALFDLQRDPLSARLRQAKGIPKTISDVREWLNLKIASQNSRDFILAIRNDESALLVGYITLRIDCDGTGVAEFGIVIGKNRRNGAGSESLRCVETLARESFGYSFIKVNVIEENKIAMNFFLKSGFVIIENSEKVTVLIKQLI
jgi:RimJ/RimL family protein N-acetyltransferase